MEEGIALRAGDMDTVYVNGYGFPAWSGGPMYWAQHAGMAHVVETMRRLRRPTARAGGRRRCWSVAAAGQGWDNVARREARDNTTDHGA